MNYMIHMRDNNEKAGTMKHERVPRSILPMIQEHMWDPRLKANAPLGSRSYSVRSRKDLTPLSPENCSKNDRRRSWKRCDPRTSESWYILRNIFTLESNSRSWRSSKWKEEEEYRRNRRCLTKQWSFISEVRSSIRAPQKAVKYLGKKLIDSDPTEKQILKMEMP